MHIEVTDCQRNIPTLEKNAVSEKRARQKKSAWPKVLRDDSNIRQSERSACSTQVAQDYWNAPRETRKDVLQMLKKNASRLAREN
ncbi:hypothetical protein [Pseudomonas glycinae]|uniref:hypothetical protein n=1 Tax=Pseudomonas glycinae TaxID=1785145 RepID=UPI00131F1BDE|nr:hypothetical protein [Pseudomonas glycinae]